ncbi:MAG: sigma-70 family RNA polymerase sigma factor, partial [Proteobacteria bacterium]|nr:sigma-70 family RNA polymerase sigma factor [Pseudomonadota bacterium]
MKAGVGRYQQFIRIDQENVDKKSREELILEYAPLVKTIVERIAIRLPPHISKDELISGGIMGLFDALDKFDPGKGTKFRTYATLRIKGAIIDELRKMDWVSRSVRRDIHKIEDARRTFERKFGRGADDHEIAEEMGIDSDSYHRMTT